MEAVEPGPAAHVPRLAHPARQRAARHDAGADGEAASPTRRGSRSRATTRRSRARSRSGTRPKRPGSERSTSCGPSRRATRRQRSRAPSQSWTRRATRRRRAREEGVAVGRHPRLGSVPAPEARRRRLVRGVRVAEAAGRRWRTPRRRTSCGGSSATARASRRRSRSKTVERAGGAVPLLPLAPAVPAGVREGRVRRRAREPAVGAREAAGSRSSSRRATPEIANAPNAAARKKLIAQLRDDGPGSVRTLVAPRAARPKARATSIRQSGRYPLCGKGDVNTYAIFAEHNRSVLGAAGRAGFIVPTGIATDDTTKEFFADARVEATSSRASTVSRTKS